jgi:hypothetical protein
MAGLILNSNSARNAITASQVASCHLYNTRKRARLLVFECFYLILPTTTVATHQLATTITMMEDKWK